MKVPELRWPFSRRRQARLVLGIFLAWMLVESVISIPGGFAWAEEANEKSPPSNEEFLRQSVRLLFERSFDDFPEANSNLLFLRAEREHPGNWLLENELVSHLLSMKYQVALRSSETDGNSEESSSLFYRIIEMRLDYPQANRKGFLGARMVSRRSYLNLSFRLEEATGKVLWTSREQEESLDVVKRSMVESLNNESYPMLSPSLPDDSQSRFMEPALVAVVVGGLIYLFFASR